jgi:hypothetical protein
MSQIISRAKRGRKGRRGTAKRTDGVGQYASDAWSLAKRTAYGLNEIRKLINIETKFVDTVSGLAAATQSGVVTCVSQLAQGLTSTDRVGDSIRLQHIEVRGTIIINAAATNTTVRVLVFRDLDGYGTAPTGADVLENVGGTVAPNSPYRFNRRERFSILYDEMFQVQSILAQGTSSAAFYYSSAHEGHVKYLAATASAAANGKGSVYVMAISEEPTNTPTYDFYSRILFTDD